MKALLILLPSITPLLGQEPSKHKNPGATSEPPSLLSELTAEVFKFIRLEQLHTDIGDIPQGIFRFRYQQQQGLVFWGFGKGKDGFFTPRELVYSVRQKTGWQIIPSGFKGNGAETFPFAPGRDHNIRVNIALLTKYPGQDVRVSFDSPTGRFWSEPFKLPR